MYQATPSPGTADIGYTFILQLFIGILQPGCFWLRLLSTLPVRHWRAYMYVTLSGWKAVALQSCAPQHSNCLVMYTKQLCMVLIYT